jgi:LL-diaminopimelate aminotransferase
MPSFIFADRIAGLPPYLFAAIDKVKAKVAAGGTDIISLGIGDPDMPTPAFIVEAMARAIRNPAHHRYPSYRGMEDFRREVAAWYKRRFGADLNPDDEVICTIGAKEAIAHFPFAFVNPGDTVIVCQPGYPVYPAAAAFCGGIVRFLPLLEENDFLPDLDGVDAATWDKAKIIFLNYPNNPTSATAAFSFFEKLVAICRRHNVILAHDATYTEIYYDPDSRPLSVFNVPGAKDVAVEFHSFSKTFNMTGWRVGMTAGNPLLIEGLAKIKENLDSGTFHAVQEASVAALREGDAFCEELRGIYKKRRDTVVRALSKIGIEHRVPQASLYVWARVPRGYTSASFVTKVIEEKGVVLTPGNGFGDAGEGYFRISLTVNTERLEEAVERINSL